MYIPAAFEITDFQTILAFLQDHPFGVLTVNGRDGVPLATHLPFLLQIKGETIVLEGHIAKVNEQEAYLKKGAIAKMIVNGAHGYVSSSLYGHVNVPTYNYQAVHLTGTIDILNESELLEHLKTVVGNFEANREKPIDFDQWPLKMIAHLMEEITGFRLAVSKTEAGFKLSQNRNEADLQNIIKDLQKGNPDQQKLAEEMSKCAIIEHLSPPLEGD